MPSTIAKTMWPPSSGSNGSRLSSAIESEISAEHPEEAVGALLGRVGRALDDSDRARDVLPPLARSTRLPSDGDDALATRSPVTRTACLRGRRRRQARAPEDEAEPVDAVASSAAARGPSVTRLPLRSTMTAERLPLRGADRAEIVFPRRHRRAVDREIWSPDCEAERCAAADFRGHCRRSSSPCRPDVMNRPVKRTNAKMMFAAGPAKITSTRFQVRARQYASGPSASPMSVTPLSTPCERRLRELTLGGERRERAERRRWRASWSPDAERAAAAGRRLAGQLRRLLDQPGRRRGRRRPAPAGACPGSSRSRRAGSSPIPYSIPFRVRLTSAGGKPM